MKRIQITFTEATRDNCVCSFCNTEFEIGETMCASAESAATCWSNTPIPPVQMVRAKPPEARELEIWQALIDSGALRTLDLRCLRETGKDGGWLRMARLLIADGKCRRPRSKKAREALSLAIVEGPPLPR
jgi:hypothetical protein